MRKRQLRTTALAVLMLAYSLAIIAFGFWVDNVVLGFGSPTVAQTVADRALSSRSVGPT